MKQIASTEIIETLYEIEEGILKVSIRKDGERFKVGLSYLVSTGYLYERSLLEFSVDNIDDENLPFMIESSYNMYKPSIKEFIEDIWKGSIPTCGEDVSYIIDKLD